MNNIIPNKAKHSTILTCLLLFVFFTFSFYSYGATGAITMPMPLPNVKKVNPTPAPVPIPVPIPSPTPSPTPSLKPSPAPSPTPASNPNEYIKINLNHITQERNLCVPTCASMMLFKFGWNYTPRQLKLMTLNKTYYGPAAPFNDYTGMKFIDLISALRTKANIKWTERLYPGTYNGYLMGLNDIKNSLRKGYPVMIGLYYGAYGHVVTVCGFDEKNKTIIVNDPLLRSPGLKTIRYNDIQGTFWSNRAFNSSMRSVVYMY